MLWAIDCSVLVAGRVLAAALFGGQSSSSPIGENLSVSALIARLFLLTRVMAKDAVGLLYRKIKSLQTKPSNVTNGLHNRMRVKQVHRSRKGERSTSGGQEYGVTHRCGMIANARESVEKKRGKHGIAVIVMNAAVKEGGGCITRGGIRRVSNRV